MNHALYFWGGLLIAVIGTSGTLIGGIMVQKHWGYWEKTEAKKEDKGSLPMDKKIEIIGDVVISKNQSGGITAHTVNINEFPEPKFDIKTINSDMAKNGTFKTEVLLSIESKTTLKNLYLEARAPTILDFEAVPQRTGVSMPGHTGKRDGYAFTNIPNAYGTYMLRIITNKPDKIEIIYNYE